MEKNGNGEKTDGERGENGRYLDGNPGGPGRGKKSNDINLDLDSPAFWDELATNYTPDLSSKDDATRQKGGKMLIEIKKLKDASELKRSTDDKFSRITDPVILEYLRIQTNIASYFGGMEGVRKWLEKSLKVCLGCDKFPGEKIPFGFNFEESEGE
jgi:hypothetical protein